MSKSYEALGDIRDSGVAIAQRADGTRLAGQLDRRRHQGGFQAPQRRPAVRDPHPDAGPVGRPALIRDAEQVVVHLHDQLAARRHLEAETGRHERLTGARSPVRDPGRVPRHTGVTEAGPALARRLRVDVGGGLGLLGAEPVEDRVVHDAGVLRQEAAAGQVRGLGQLRIDDEAPVFVGAAVRGRGGVGPRQGQVDEPLPLTQRGWGAGDDAQQGPESHPG
ncbi:hypothetical protein ACWEOZ_37630 [Actinoplanes sp. NPDC004185]